MRRSRPDPFRDDAVARRRRGRSHAPPIARRALQEGGRWGRLDPLGLHDPHGGGSARARPRGELFKIGSAQTRRLGRLQAARLPLDALTRGGDRVALGVALLCGARRRGVSGAKRGGQLATAHGARARSRDGELGERGKRRGGRLHASYAALREQLRRRRSSRLRDRLRQRRAIERPARRRAWGDWRAWTTPALTGRAALPSSPSPKLAGARGRSLVRAEKPSGTALAYSAAPECPCGLRAARASRPSSPKHAHRD